MLPQSRKSRPRTRIRKRTTRVIVLNKPYRVLCQFRRNDERATLGDFVPIPGVYPAGRLDYDSEGLLVLTNDGALQNRLTDPSARTSKTYWAQVEGVPDANALAALARGVVIGGRATLTAEVHLRTEPSWLWPREPPIRVRRAIPTTWLELTLREGRNRQVRRMTAAIGHPTLRLIRSGSGPYRLNDLAPGEWKEVRPLQ